MCGNTFFYPGNHPDLMYSVDDYLGMMEAADRAPSTIAAYRQIFRSFAKFLGVPLEDVHTHISSENLIKYAGSMKGLSGLTVRQRLSILRAYAIENGIEFKPMQRKVLSARRRYEPQDKPPTLELLQQMMDLADIRAKSFITLTVSTAIRPGEAAQLLLSDIDGDVVTIRNAIAKGGRGGTVYLTEEAREYLDIWLQNRDEFVRLADLHSEVFSRHGVVASRPKNDRRVYAGTYSGLLSMFQRLYDGVDGERGGYRRRITPHSLRKYFRTQAAQGGLHVDIVEHLMRHTGYLSGSYVRLTPDQIRDEFHKHEGALYITRTDPRAKTEIDLLKRENATLRAEQEERTAELARMQEADRKVLDRLLKKAGMKREEV